MFPRKFIKWAGVLLPIIFLYPVSLFGQPEPQGLLIYQQPATSFTEVFEFRSFRQENAKPFKHWVAQPPPAAPPSPTEIGVRSYAPAPGNWMWDPNRAGPLDRGRYNRDHDVTRAPEIYYP